MADNGAGNPPCGAADSFEQLMADDTVTVFLMHRMVKVNAAPVVVSSRIRTRPRFDPHRDYDQIDSEVEFQVRDADEVEELGQQGDI